MANLKLGTNTVIAHMTSGSAAMVPNAEPGDMKYWLGLGVNYTNSTVTIGSGTPWKGLAVERNADRRYSSGTLYVDDGSGNGSGTPALDSIPFFGTGGRTLYIGDNNTGVTILPAQAGQGRFYVDIVGTRVGLGGGKSDTGATVATPPAPPVWGSGALGDFSGVEEWRVNAGSTMFIERDNAMGGGVVGGKAAAPAPTPSPPRCGSWTTPASRSRAAS